MSYLKRFLLGWFCSVAAVTVACLLIWSLYEFFFWLGNISRGGALITGAVLVLGVSSALASAMPDGGMGPG